ncbi:MAG: hypothetical protein GXP45_01670 [bacterium]|nr:hypothetical protein [bacterium]
MPVLTDISYDNLSVGNGGVATDLLRKIAENKIPSSVAEQGIKDLLTYCEQDTWAMVRIRQVVQDKIAS